MRHRTRETPELRTRGMGLSARFALLMTAATVPILGISGFLLNKSVGAVAEQTGRDALIDSAKAHGEREYREREKRRLKWIYEALDLEWAKAKEQSDEVRRAGRLPGEANADYDIRRETAKAIEARLKSMRREYGRRHDQAIADPELRYLGRSAERATSYPGGVLVGEVTYGPQDRPGWLFSYRPDRSQDPVEILMHDQGSVATAGILGLMLGTTLVIILVVGGMAVWVGNQVSRPIDEIIQDIRQISIGNQSHRERVTGGGEVATHARAVDKMARGLSEAQETELELQIRDREVEVASEVRDALLTDSIPGLSGYDLAAAHMASERLGGDFLDFIELGGGRIGLLVCEVSGRGLPGALVGAVARAYLRVELSRGGDVKEALLAVNLELARHMRRGMFVTALYALIDPAQALATVACAGHKIPLVRYTNEDGQVRLIQPEGIALGFDQGPIFERALQVQQVPLDPGDRLVLTNTGAVEIADAEGAEFGEKAFYAKIKRHGANSSDEFLERMQTVIEAYVEDELLPRDITIITIARDLEG